MRRRPWWIAAPVTLVLLALLDLAVRAWHPWPARLPQHFSTAYFDRLLDDRRNAPGLVVLAGDSVVWGYKLEADRSLGAQLQAALPQQPILNLSVEGGSPANTYVAVSELLRHGVRPRLVVLNLNLKEFSPGDRSYERILPAFERAARALPAAERSGMVFQDGSHPTAAAQAIERVWAFYRYRTDIRQLLFGDADAASRLSTIAQDLSGRSARQTAIDAPTADKYLGTYDLTPITAANASLHYTALTLRALHARGIPVLAFATPANHALLHDTIDVPEYDANRARVAAAARADGARVVDYDRAFAGDAFFDNDHLKAGPTRALAERLAAEIGRTR